MGLLVHFNLVQLKERDKEVSNLEGTEGGMINFWFL
jgi:hypothetical protein